MNILFATADDIAFLTLKAIFLSGSKNFSLTAVLAGKRDNKVKKSLVRDFCKDNGILYLCPESLKEKERVEIRELGADFLLSFSISRIFGEKFLSIFSKGKINIHPSALPKYRGCSPLQFSILNGDVKSSISFQDIALRMDEGDVYKRVDFEIEKEETISSLREKVSLLASVNIVSFLDAYSQGLLKAKKQEGEASYTKLIEKEDGKIDFTLDDSISCYRKFRAFSPWPSIYAFLDGKRLIFTDIKTVLEKDADSTLIEKSKALEPGSIVSFEKDKKALLIKLMDGFLLAKKLKLENKKELGACDFYNGFKSYVLEHKKLS